MSPAGSLYNLGCWSTVTQFTFTYNWIYYVTKGNLIYPIVSVLLTAPLNIAHIGHLANLVVKQAI